MRGRSLLPKSVREELEAIVDKRLQNMGEPEISRDEMISHTQEEFRKTMERLLIEKTGSFRLREFQSLAESTANEKAAYKYARRYLKPDDVVPKALAELRVNFFGSAGQQPRIFMRSTYGGFLGRPQVDTATGRLLHMYGYEIKDTVVANTPQTPGRDLETITDSMWSRGDRLSVAQLVVAVAIGVLAIAATLFSQEIRHFLFVLLGLGSGP
jgi:hypothetical protein